LWLEYDWSVGLADKCIPLICFKLKSSKLEVPDVLVAFNWNFVKVPCALKLTVWVPTVVGIEISSEAKKLSPPAPFNVREVNAAPEIVYVKACNLDAVPAWEKLVWDNVPLPDEYVKVASVASTAKSPVTLQLEEKSPVLFNISVASSSS